VLLFAEHIGTKTAVQIRSHAQKFFNKLEKKKEAGEAPDKGVRLLEQQRALCSRAGNYGSS
jgi:hypothetical protein